MNKIFFVLLFSLSFLSCAGPILTATLEQEKSLEEIKEYPTLTKQEIFKNSVSWVARSYNSSNDVVQLKDSTTGQIICQGLASTTFELGIKRYFRYTMIIDIKDNRMRLRFSNIKSEYMGPVAGPDVNYSWKYINLYFKDLRKTIFESVENITKEDSW